MIGYKVVVFNSEQDGFIKKERMIIKFLHVFISPIILYILYPLYIIVYLFHIFHLYYPYFYYYLFIILTLDFKTMEKQYVQQLLFNSK